MQKRSMITLNCPSCNIERTVRKDGAGKFCRSCKAKSNCRTGHYKDLTNHIYGKIKVLSLAFKKNDEYFWKCACECGNEFFKNARYLVKNKSCGCMAKTRQGESQSQTYRSWRAMMQRCNDNKVSHYARYGFKGISVCESWLEYDNFKKDMGLRPINTTLDRINPSSNYNKENCRWATILEQSNNRSDNLQIFAFGERRTLAEWSRSRNISWSTLRKRIVNLEWNPEKALTKPVRKQNGKRNKEKQIQARN